VTPQLFASKFTEFGQKFPPKKLQSPSHALFLCYQVTKLVAQKNIDCKPLDINIISPTIWNYYTFSPIKCFCISLLVISKTIKILHNIFLDPDS
jgi:hypothetical protein